MRILILTQYFPPEVGAAQTRLYEMALALLNCGVDVDVFTALPSYPLGRIFDNYKGCFFKKDQIDGININRVWSYTSNELGVIKRLISYSSFSCLALLALTKVKPRPDLIFVESPPLTLGMTAYLLSKLWGCPWIFNISDLWPDSIFALGAMSKDSLSGKSLTMLERFLYKKALGITAVTEGIMSDLLYKKKIPKEKILYLPNGANVTSFQPVDTFKKKKQKKFIYTGRIGSAHGVEVIAKAAHITSSREDIYYEVVGDGPKLSKIVELSSSLKNNNIQFMGPIPLSQMPEKLATAYASIVTLKDLSFFKGTRPAKMMSYLAAGLPIIYSGSGEGAELIRELGAGIVTQPEDVRALADAILWLADHPQEASEMGKCGRKYAEDHLDWNALVKNWLSDVEKFYKRN